jgi:hypothetical protein
MILDMLAGLYFEVGRYTEAAKTTRQCLSLSTQQNNRKLAESLKSRIAYYESQSHPHQWESGGDSLS